MDNLPYSQAVFAGRAEEGRMATGGWDCIILIGRL